MTRKALVVYLVCEPQTPELARAAVESGADLIELTEERFVTLQG